MRGRGGKRGMPRTGALHPCSTIQSSLFPAPLQIGEQGIASIEGSISLGIGERMGLD